MIFRKTPNFPADVALARERALGIDAIQMMFFAHSDGISLSGGGV